MLTMAILLLALGAAHLLRTGWGVSRSVPQRNEDMIFF
jgi:hypothetical protein